MALRTPFANDAKTYGFEWLRFMIETGDVQEGVLGMQAAAADFKITLGSTGLRVTVNAGAAFVKGDSGAAGVGISQGLFVVVNDANIVDADTLAAADPTNPRIDQVCLRVRDSSDLATGADDATIVHLTGTPTGGATLDNRNGAVALPNDHIRLADILVPAAAATLLAGNVRDRRPWARGVYNRIIRNANAAAGSDYSTTSNGVVVDIDATNLSPRIECSGTPLRVTLRGRVTHASAGGFFGANLTVDGAYIDGSASNNFLYTTHFAASGQEYPLDFQWDFLPSAGSHVLRPQYATGALNPVTVEARAAVPLIFTVEEIVRQNANNT